MQDLRPLSDSRGLAVGEPVTVSGTDGKATVTLVKAEPNTVAGSEFADPPKLGNDVLLEVSYEATEGTSSYNPFDWSLRDADGRQYQDASYSGFDPLLSSGVLAAAGSKARGLIVIDALVGPLTAEYPPGYQAPATWLIP